MSALPMHVRLATVKVAAITSVLAFAGFAHGQESGPFGGLAGSWSGSGSIVISNGVAERIRCRARYDVGGSGTMVQLQLRCASDSYKFELQSNVNNQNGEVSGDWSEQTRGAAGKIAGTAKGDRIDVRVDGQTFSALLTLTTRGNRQSISIKAPAGSEMSEATITLNRGS